MIGRDLLTINVSFFALKCQYEKKGSSQGVALESAEGQKACELVAVKRKGGRGL